MTPPEASRNRNASAPSPKLPARAWDRARESPLLSFLAVLLAALFALFLIVMIGEPEWFYHLSGIADGDDRKFTALKSLGVAMGGVILAIQAANSHRRAKAMDESAKAQADATKQQTKANENAEKGLRQERLKNAIEHLGHASDSVRLGGAYELFHLAQDNEELRQTALDILCAHVRGTTGEAEYRRRYASEPSEEIQSLLTLLFVQEHEVFKGLRTNLRGSWLNGVSLQGAHLEEANLAGAHLRAAWLRDSYLQGSNLAGAQMQGADLLSAYLQCSNLMRARMQGAYLPGTRMQNATLGDAQLQGCYLSKIEMQGATFGKARMEGAGRWWDPRLPFRERIKEAIGKESDFSGVVFSGGLRRKKVEALTKGLSDWEKEVPDLGGSYCGAAPMLRRILESHIDQPPVCEPWEGMGIHAGFYSKEQAEQWIAEYEAAVAEIPKKDAG